MKSRIVLTILSIMVLCQAYAYDIAVENEDGVIILYNYINDGTELEVDGCTLGVKKINIPKEVTYRTRTRKVTSIGSRAFEHTGSEYNTHLESVTIPNSIKKIGSFAFAYTYLKSVTIPNSVKEIGTHIFYKCRFLESVIISDSVTIINDNSFYECFNLESVHIGNSVKTIKDCAFARCTSLTSVTIPYSVTTIGGGAFGGCTGLISVTIPNSVTEIGNGAFKGCSNLSSLIIPNSVTSIGENAFYGCSNLSFLNISTPNTEMRIFNNAFSKCTSLTTVTIPPNVKAFGCFAYCTKLSSVTIYGKLADPVDSYAYGYYPTFKGSNNIISVIIKEGCQSGCAKDCFTDDVFYNATLYVPIGTKEKYKSQNYWNKFIYIEEGEPTYIYHLSANDFHIYTKDGVFYISGMNDGQCVAIYQIDGKQVASANAYDGTANIVTNLSSGTVAIVKVDDKAIKVMMK